MRPRFVLLSLTALLALLPLALAQPKTVLEQTFFYQSDGLKVRARTFFPSGKGPFAGVVFNHGGVDGLSDSSVLRCRELARAGFAVFASSYRGEDGSQGQIEVAKGEVNDVLNGLTFFKRDPRVDAGRIAMVGTSHGALIGLLTASRTNALRGLVFAYGVANIYAWWDHLVATFQVGTDDLTKRIYGTGPASRPESFRVRNGMAVLEKVKTPVLILQGQLDTVVPPAQAEALYAALTTQGTWAQLELYPNSEHGFWTKREDLERTHGTTSLQAEESRQALESTLGFLRQVLH